MAMLALLPAPGATAQPAPAGDERVRLGEEYDRQMAAGQYPGALEAARRIVDLMEATDPSDPALAEAYVDLGRAQLRGGDAPGARKSLTRSLDLLAGMVGIASPRLLAPLRLLGEAYAAEDQPASAIEALQRGITISQRSLGLFNPEQLPMVESLIGLYERVGDEDGLDREMSRAILVAERVYGVDDARLLPLIERLALRLERTDRYAPARAQWARMVEIASREGGGRNAATVNGLLGVARSHRLQYVRDPRSIVVNTCRTDPQTGQPEPLTICTELGRPVPLDEDGEAAALEALALLESAASPPPRLLAATLLELGDWYVTAHESGRGIGYYQRAWPLLSALATPSEPNPLLLPRPLEYRTPLAARQYVAPAGRRHAVREIEFTLTVLADGGTADIQPASDAPEARLVRIRRALEDARFSPRFIDGQPVPTEGYRFVEYWFEPALEAPAAAEPGPEP